MKKRSILVLILVLACFLGAMTSLESGRQSQGRQQLEDVVRRTAVTCYASEGYYPPSVEYMVERYGLQYNRQVYAVRYEVFATNLMPDITVVEVGP